MVASTGVQQSCPAELVVEDDESPTSGIPRATMAWEGMTILMWAMNREKRFAWRALCYAVDSGG